MMHGVIHPSIDGKMQDNLNGTGIPSHIEDVKEISLIFGIKQIGLQINLK
jgi:hypothetical protein